MHVLLSVFLLLACSYRITSFVIPDVTDVAESARIVNGYAVDITDVPYQASLRRKVSSDWAHICGAVIISSTGILTAAHCVLSYRYTPSSLRIAVGTNYRSSGGKTYDISSIVIHEEYSTTTLMNDIALLTTTKTISFSETTYPIAIAEPTLALPEGTKALVSGYGMTSYGGSSSSVLLAAQVYIVSQATCARSYLHISSITNGMICANAISPPRDACQGDSGGPLVAYNNLIGIVSWGEGCALSTYPGVYTKVSEYYDWIQRKTTK